MKRNQLKRQREDDLEKENVKNLSVKRPKVEDLSEKTELSDENKNYTTADDEKQAKNDDSDAKEEDTKMDDVEEEGSPIIVKRKQSESSRGKRRPQISREMNAFQQQEMVAKSKGKREISKGKSRIRKQSHFIKNKVPPF